MSKKILFMCPHNAAKSILAMAYAHQYSDQHPEQDLSFFSTGTEPDEEHSQMVLQFINKNNLTLPTLAPRLVSQGDFDEADLVISMGCDLSQFKYSSEKVIEWRSVPDTSVDLESSAGEISERVSQLLSGLA